MTPTSSNFVLKWCSLKLYNRAVSNLSPRNSRIRRRMRHDNLMSASPLQLNINTSSSVYCPFQLQSRRVKSWQAVTHCTRWQNANFAVTYQKSSRLSRAGFTLSRALFRKKCGALQLGRQTLFFLKKNGKHFSHHSRFIRGSPIFPACKNLPLLLWGPFLRGPLFGRTCWTCLNPPLCLRSVDRLNV